MSFLRCIPTVFVIGGDYEILVCVSDCGLCSVDVNGIEYQEENSGVLSSEKLYFKIRIPQNKLNEAKKYTVVYRKTLERKSYFSRFDDEERMEFSFKPLLKDEGINIYHLADVHYRFEQAEMTAGYFGEEVDLYIFNGDIGEVESEDDYYNVCRLTGKISKGGVPVVFSRGNHDTRGRLAERFTDFFPSCGKNTYYTFNLGPLYGIVLDCGEDKWDSHPEYGSTAAFHSFRLRQVEFLKGLDKKEELITFGVCHICPADTTETKGSVFDIEGEIYEEWNNQLARLNTCFMLSGHVHKAYYLEKNSKKSIRNNPYAVIVGSEKQKDNLLGAALTVYRDRVAVRFTDVQRNVIKEFEIKIKEQI